jgi:hypothetical protein
MWTCKLKVDEEKLKHAGLAKQKMVLAQHFCIVCWGWYKAQQSLTPVVDWLDSLIGPSELLLVVLNLFAVAVLVLCVGLENSK